VFGTTEIVLILTLAVIFLGPEGLPDLARMLAKARRQYDDLMNSINSSIQSIEKDVTTAADINPPTAKKLRERDEKLIVETARKMEIPTEGRSVEAISEDIIAKTREKKGSKKEESAASQKSSEED
jgi:Sec-independent protein translocase protein TatA